MQDVLDAIMFAIENATYTERTTDRSWHTEVQQHKVVKKENLPYLKSAITGELVNITSRIAELEAKVTAYEAIISNSNFAPMLQVSRVNDTIAQSGFHELQDEFYDVDTTLMFVDAITTLLATGVNKTWDLDNDPGDCELDKDGVYIGWHDKTCYYLDPNSSIQAVSEYYNREGRFFPANRITLEKNLKNRQFTVLKYLDRGVTMEKTIRCRPNRVLPFYRHIYDNTNYRGNVYDRPTDNQ